ncbi:MAG: dynamin family protein [Hyphomicrobiaceae bacterium]|nr:dynamin family protein [Hyphomicrobiaceae bacterium]
MTETSSARSNTTPNATDARPLLGQGIGSTLQQARQDLMGIGQVLEQILEPAGVALAREMQQLLADQICKIAVVGQIKAGKSCFINALTDLPGFLPTDLNPSTSAITQLHFNQSAPTGDAAVFHFFTQEEWQNLATGSGPIRDLTQRLVLGFEPALLRQNVSAVIAQARSRLGDAYEQLLGRAHAYGDVDREVLLKYVCAADPVPEDDTGLYSEITKSADLYLADGPFEFPVTVIDTPGTNDPFLIRDEITRRSLDQADAYIVVLSAHQPLSEGDVSLLRILRGLHKERIIVFINRIDELGDVENDVGDIVAYVHKRLAIEFPGFEIPIVAGSARLARTAVIAPGGGISDAGSIDNRANEHDQHSRMKQNLSAVHLARSGMREMQTVLDDLLTTTHSAYVIRQIARCYSEMAQASEATVRHELAMLRQSAPASLEGFEEENEELLRLQGEQKSLAATRDVFSRVPTDLAEKLEQMLQDNLDQQRGKLIEIVDGHADYERVSLIATLKVRRAGKTWTCDANSLRRSLEQAFHDGFQGIEAALIQQSASVAQNLNQVIEILMPGATVPPQPFAGGVVAPPSPSSLGRPLALELGTSWWQRLWQAQPTPREQGLAVEQLVKDEFHPIVDSLLTSQHEALSQYIVTTTRWSAAVCQNIVQALERRHASLASYLEARRGNMAVEQAAELEAQHEAAIVALERHAAMAADAMARLAGARRAIDGWFS